MLRIEAVAVLLGRSRSTAYRLIRREGLPTVMLRTGRVVPRARFERWLQRRVLRMLAQMRREETPLGLHRWAQVHHLITSGRRSPD
ncbi:MAG: helix-turn-helix domain-containing protein [Candidatus Rokubacteria bacterium]|nr:helix-turn-helix domain-containing protein [Candidatus Rokubacteria bacterium]